MLAEMLYKRLSSHFNLLGEELAPYDKISKFVDYSTNNDPVYRGDTPYWSFKIETPSGSNTIVVVTVSFDKFNKSNDFYKRKISALYKLANNENNGRYVLKE